MTGGLRLGAFRQVLADILMPSGWLEGTFMVPQSQSFTDYLEHAGVFLKVTDARLPAQTSTVPFFALHRGAVHIIAPKGDADPVETEGAGGLTSPWSIACLFDHGVLNGRLDFLVNMRLSDYLRQQTGYLVVRDASWSTNTPMGDPGWAARWPAVIVNVPQLNGISETDTQPVPGHPRRLPPTEFTP